MIRSMPISLAAALIVLAPVASSAADVCALSDANLRRTLESGAAQIGTAYKINQPYGQACNWDCNGSLADPMVKAFGFLQYNCAATTAKSSTRRPTGSGTRSQMGLSITDADYRDAADAIAGGALMQVPPSIEEASKSGKVADVIAAAEALRDVGVEWLEFSSTSVNNDGQGADRILIRVPDTADPMRFEQWIQIAIKDGGGLGRNVDFIARRLNTDPQEVVFRGYSRTARGFVPEGFGSRSELSKCYSCHPSGLRTVVPAAAGSRAVGGKKAMKPVGTMMVGGTLEDQLAHVRSLTESRAVFGPAGYTAAENGPVYGPSGRAGREEFIEKSGCAKGVRKDRYEAIASRMDCESCHDGSTDRGILVAGTSRGTIYHKVVENREAPMPPGVTDPPNSAERQALYACLKAEYGSLLREWLVSDLPSATTPDASNPSVDTSELGVEVSNMDSETIEPIAEDSSQTDAELVSPSGDSSEEDSETFAPDDESSEADSDMSEPGSEDEEEATTSDQD